MNPDLDLLRVDRILNGGPIRRAFWRLVHKMPCAVVHRVCSLCRDEGVCGRCFDELFEQGTPVQVTGPPTIQSTTQMPVGWFVAPNSTSWSAGTSYTFRNGQPQ